MAEKRTSLDQKAKGHPTQPPVHPGEFLREDFLKPMGISQNKLAQALGVSPRRISEIVNEKRSVTADTAMRLGKFFDMTPAFWLNMQMRYDLDLAEDEMRERIEREVKTKDEVLTRP
jgi:addiction module HigA family antidote